VTLSPGAAQRAAVSGWRWKPDDHPAASADTITAPDRKTDGSDWKDAAPVEDVFHGRKGFVWYRTTLDAVPGPHRRLHFENVDDNATVYLNGVKLATHEGWGQPFDVSLDTAWREAGPNVITVLVQNNDGPGGILGEVTLESVSAAEGAPVRGWRMR